MDRLQIDLKEMTLYEESNDGYKYFLTVVDHFSGYPWVFPLFTKTSTEVSFHLVELFTTFGPPRILHSDNGGEFVNELVSNIAKIFHFELARGKAYNPREQGLVEKFNGTMATTLSKLMSERESQRWIDMVQEALFSYRITKGAHGHTPFKVFFCREPNLVYNYPGTKLDEVPTQTKANEMDAEKVQELIADLHEGVRGQREKNAALMKARWDTKNTQQVKASDYVLVDPRKNYKRQPKRVLGERIFSKPAIVKQVNSNGNVHVLFKNGTRTIPSEPIPNNKFKVVSKEIYDSVPMDGMESEEKSESDEEFAMVFDNDENNDNNVDENNKNNDKNVNKNNYLPLTMEQAGDVNNMVNTDIAKKTSDEDAGTNYDYQPEKGNFVPDQRISYMNLPDVWIPIPNLQVEIYWKKDDAWNPGKVVKYKKNISKWRINYVDLDKSDHKFNPKKWRVPYDQNPRLLKSFKKTNNIK
jgi:hypothetical protein